jgi:flagellar basal body-associated protein FliL
LKDILIYILGALTTVATQVVSYFFGSSSGSAEKTKALNDLFKKS